MGGIANAVTGMLGGATGATQAQTASQTAEGIQNNQDKMKAQDAQQKYSQAVSEQSSISSLMHNLAKEIIGNFPKR